MVTKTKTNWFDGQEGNYVFPVEYIEDGMITRSQKKTLTDLILQNVYDEDDREQKISQLSELSSSEADDFIFDLSRW